MLVPVCLPAWQHWHSGILLSSWACVFARLHNPCDCFWLLIQHGTARAYDHKGEEKGRLAWCLSLKFKTRYTCAQFFNLLFFHSRFLTSLSLC